MRYLALACDYDGTLALTVQPDTLARPLLSALDLVLAAGEAPASTLGNLARALGEAPPAAGSVALEREEFLVWDRRNGGLSRVRLVPGRAERRRHRRKYAEGELPPDRSFYFRGPAGKLNLRAQNLILFLQLAEGVDDETWMYHLRRGDYSRWFEDAVKDRGLAREARLVERTPGISARESRARIRSAVESRYTLAG